MSVFSNFRPPSRPSFSRRNRLTMRPACSGAVSSNAIDPTMVRAKYIHGLTDHLLSANMSCSSKSAR